MPLGAPRSSVASGRAGARRSQEEDMTQYVLRKYTGVPLLL